MIPISYSEGVLAGSLMAECVILLIVVVTIATLVATFRKKRRWALISNIPVLCKKIYNLNIISVNILL